jgi:hypothetical protein
MAFYLENDLPEMPTGYLESVPNPLIFTGRLKRFLRTRLIHKSRKNAEIWWSVLQGVKRGAHEAPSHFVFESYLKHRRKLTKAPTNTIHPKFIEKVHQFLENYDAPKPQLYEVSTSASYDTTRDDGGQRDDVRQWLKHTFGYTNELEKVKLSNKVSMQAYGPDIPKDRKGKYDFESVVEEAHKDFTPGPLQVEVHGILEPLKVRLITKGESVPYWLARSCQKAMWNYLQNYETFVATGRPLEDQDLNDLINKRTKFQEKHNLRFDSWVSGDYSGATDGVDIRCTALIFENILKRSPYSDKYKDLLRLVIYKQELNYPPCEVRKEIPCDLKLAMRKLNRDKTIKRKYDVETRQVLPAVQETGQLMGSVLSFPILCIINLVSYWISMEEYLGKELTFEELPVLINGDDILFPSNSSHYDIWKDMIKSVGFSLSIGKNYIHKDLFTINSIMFHESNNQVTRYKFFNVGLLTGKAKVTGRANLQDKPIWDWYAEVIDGATDKVRAHRRFLHYHRSTIDRLTYDGSQNLFISRWYGGCGFKLDPEVANHVAFTTYQRRRAFFYRSYIERLVKRGKDPTKHILRLVPNEDHSSYACVNLGFHDKLRLIPKTQPLNINQDLETKRLYNLPLLSQPHQGNKLYLVFKPGRRIPKARRPGDNRAKMATRLLCEEPFTLVSESEFPLSYQFSDYSIDESKYFDPEIVVPTKKSVVNRKGWYTIDFSTGHILYYDSEEFSKESLSKPYVARR